ncbi:hypothetical protein PWT90_04499 [Aphanocladium album]|nr:hypothetical protein PWT90_04499 [Aphanocladium album]
MCPTEGDPGCQPASQLFVVEPTAAHTHTIILLHGLGSTGEKFGSELLDTGISSSGHKLTELLPYVRFVFPTSKRRRSKAFGRSMLTQWFDIIAFIARVGWKIHLQVVNNAPAV